MDNLTTGQLMIIWWATILAGIVAADGDYHVWVMILLIIPLVASILVFVFTVGVLLGTIK